MGNYPQILFEDFMQDSNENVFLYESKGLIVLTNDATLYNKLTHNDKKYGIHKLAFIPSPKSELAPEIGTVLTFHTERTVKDLSRISNEGSNVCLILKNEQDFYHLKELVPIIINHHIEKENINTDEFGKRVPFILFRMSRNHETIRFLEKKDDEPFVWTDRTQNDFHTFYSICKSHNFKTLSDDIQKMLDKQKQNRLPKKETTPEPGEE